MSELPVEAEKRFLIYTRKEALQSAATRPPEKPGEKARYNQTGYVLLGMIIERVTGTGFEEFIGKRLLKPLKLANTTYGDDRDFVFGRSSMYTVLEPSLDRQSFLMRNRETVPSPDKIFKATSYSYPRFAFTCGGLNSNLSNISEWELALGSGRVLKHSTMEEAAKPFKLNDGKNGSHGLGWDVGTLSGHRWMTHNGGAATQHLRYPDDHLSVIGLTNLQGTEVFRLRTWTFIAYALLVPFVGSATLDGVAQTDIWSDKSPHQSRFITGDNVKLNFLDWGGTGEVLLFLNGWAGTAHCFDDLAPRFTDRFHCMAVTRRGNGQSGRPNTGYDPMSCMEEVHGFLDAMKIPRATLVGHSFGGYLMTLFAAKYPDRVDRLVYLDAIYDYSLPGFKAARKVEAALPYPQPTKTDWASIDAYRRLIQLGFFGGKRVRPFWSDALEAEMRDDVRMLPDGTLEPLTPHEDDVRFTKECFDHAEQYPIDYQKVHSRALAICSDHTVWESMSPSLWPKNKSAINTDAYVAFVKASRKEYRKKMRNGKTVILSHTHHYSFVQRPDEVTRLMRRFLLEPARK